MIQPSILIMKIGILSRNHNLYSTRRLRQAAYACGHEAIVIDTMSVAVEMGITETASQIKLLYPSLIPRTTYLPPVDAIIPRIGASITPHGLSVVRQFEAQNVRTTATAAAIASSRDKLHSLQIMDRASLPIPKTAIIAQLDGLFMAIQAVNGLPVILKSSQGTQGHEVILAHDLKTAQAAFLRLRRLGPQVLVQEFIAEAAGKDTRVIVIGNRCVAGMQRIAASGEFRANLHLGGTAAPITLDKDTEALALAAARAHNLSVAGVDLIHAKRGLLLLEVNSSPGLQGVEQVTQVDIATQIITFLEKVGDPLPKHRPAKRRRRN